MAKNPGSIMLIKDEELERVFKKFDTDGDGKISLLELTMILNSLVSTTIGNELEGIMSELDVGGDGFIDLNEFKAFHYGSESNKELKEAFDLYDKDKNGNISSADLYSTLRSLSKKCSIKDCHRMISSVDVNDYINFEEFKMMMTKPS